MKKTLLTVVFLAAAGVAFAAAEKKAKLTPEERAARRAAAEREEYLATGGELKQPGTQQGEIYYVNCQKRADAQWIADSAAAFEKVLHVGVVVTNGIFRIVKTQPVGSASLFVVDDPNLPTSLSAPEDKWAMVNVAKLYDARLPFFRARVKKEIARAFAQLCGALSSQFKGSLMGPVVRPADLDQFEDDRLPIDVIARFPRYLEAYGVKPYRLATYDVAVQEGWAPAPTNDVQKAVKERVEKWMAERAAKKTGK